MYRLFSNTSSLKLFQFDTSPSIFYNEHNLIEALINWRLSVPNWKGESGHTIGTFQMMMPWAWHAASSGTM